MLCQLIINNRRRRRGVRLLLLALLACCLRRLQNDWDVDYIGAVCGRPPGLLLTNAAGQVPHHARC